MKVLPAQRIIRGSRWRSIAYSGDGQFFFAGNANSNMVYVFDRTLTNCVATLGPHVGVDMLTTSRDGARVATGSSNHRDVRVWDRASHSELFGTSMSRHSRISLSPDGTWLLVHGDRFDLLDLRTRQASRPLPFQGESPMIGAACFSADGRVLAVVIDQYDVQLFDLKSWRALGRLRAPREIRMMSLAFNADASALAATTSLGRVRVWDLARMRQQLAAANLDWENAPFPNTVKASSEMALELETIGRQ